MRMTDELVNELRSMFPALSRRDESGPVVFLDGPAGTQVPQRVIDAIGNYLTRHNANHDGVFATSRESDRLLSDAHAAAAEFVGSDDPGTIAFGANMTTLTLALSRALAKTWRPGDEIILTRLEHDANFTPWILAAEDAGAVVHYVDIDTDDCTLRVDQYQDLLCDRTRLVAVGCASNAVGTINPVARICEMAQQAGAISFLDAVHFAPHDLIDVSEWDCDFLACSAYKFFGPHVGILYGKRHRLESIQPYKLRPSPDDLPGKWMTGTQNHECIAGVLAAIDYLADVGRSVTGQPSLGRRPALRSAYESIRVYEKSLLERLLGGLSEIDGIKSWGITDPQRLDQRFPTVSITHERMDAKSLARRLADDGIYVWHGNFYALPLTERLGLEPDGMVRIGLVHYNTPAEVDRLLNCLRGYID
jgi:cysteine desulfurase family protein (TIGR01976 family)